MALLVGSLSLQGRFLVIISIKKLTRHQGHSVAGRIMSTEKFNDLFGNRTRDLPTCASTNYATACLHLRWTEVQTGSVCNLGRRHNENSSLERLNDSSCPYKHQVQRDGFRRFASSAHWQRMLPCSRKLSISRWPSDRLCGLVVRVLGYRSGGPCSIPGTNTKKK
jgi:hypothetical protein